MVIDFQTRLVKIYGEKIVSMVHGFFEIHKISIVSFIIRLVFFHLLIFIELLLNVNELENFLIYSETLQAQKL